MISDGFRGEVRPLTPVEYRRAQNPRQHCRHTAGQRTRAEPAPAIPNWLRGRDCALIREGCIHARAQAGRRREIRHAALDARAQRDVLVTLGGASDAAEEMLFDRGALHRIELSVAVRRQQRHGLIAVHWRPRLVVDTSGRYIVVHAARFISPPFASIVEALHVTVVIVATSHVLAPASTSPSRSVCRRRARYRDKTCLPARAAARLLEIRPGAPRSPAQAPAHRPSRSRIPRASAANRQRRRWPRCRLHA